MASTQVNNWADLLTAELGAKAKAHRLAMVNARIDSQGRSPGSDDRFKNKKTKIEADHASVTWVFTKEDVPSSDDLVIKAKAPADRGGHTRVWAYIEGTSGPNEAWVRKSLSDPFVAGNDLTDANRAAFFAKVSHKDGKQF